MDIDDILPFVVPDDIPEAYQPIVKLIGLDAFIKVCQYYAGEEVYFRKMETLVRKARNRMIIQEFNGKNTMLLARKYNLTVLRVKNIVSSPNEH